MPGQNLTHLISGGESDPRDGGTFSSFGQDVGPSAEPEETAENNESEMIDESPAEPEEEAAESENTAPRGRAPREQGGATGSADE
jgi:hypothetical protein